MPIMATQELLEKLAAFPIRVYDAGDVVLAEGSTTGRLMFLKSGAVDIVMNEVDLTRVEEPGAVFGDIGLLLGAPHTANVLAVRSSSFYMVEDAEGFLKSEPVAALYLATVLAARLDAVNHLVVEARRQAAATGQRRGLIGDMLDRLARALQLRVPPPSA
ncbi:MAG TPA: cyclic nucleotide-binding domain-containing protein [Geminicoccaceae bacterium]|nr:cyclic nucleotide-binding domain-containing protein [Geminicoccaceae bacterium]